MNILVIGNGFDLAHGVPTKYGDFLNFVKAFQNIDDLSDDPKNEFYKYFSNIKNDRLNLYQELDELTTDNRWLRYFIRIYEDRANNGKEGWIDFECEISSIIQTLDAARLTLNEEFKEGKETAQMKQWQLNILCPILNVDGKIQDYRVRKFTKISIGTIKYHLYDDLNKLIRCLEIYLSDFISFDKANAIKDIFDLKIDRVLSFNYTDTYKTIYDSPSSDVKYDYIHGRANIDNNVTNCNLVLGIDEYLSEDSINSDNYFIQFKKFYQRIYKGTGCNYIDWINHMREINERLKKANPPTHNIYFYGHSLDVTDGDIIRQLILAKGAKTTIFHHNKESLGCQIANLVKVIGENELIRRTYGSNRTIIFQQSSNETVQQKTAAPEGTAVYPQI